MLRPILQHFNSISNYSHIYRIFHFNFFSAVLTLSVRIRCLRSPLALFHTVCQWVLCSLLVTEVCTERHFMFFMNIRWRVTNSATAQIVEVFFLIGTKKSLLVCLFEEGFVLNVGALLFSMSQWRSCRPYCNDDVVFIDVIGLFPDSDVGSLTPMRLPRCKRNRLFDAAIVCLAVVVVLWAIGLLDHLLEKPFSEFRWPPYIDVRLEVPSFISPNCSSFALLIIV